jgi:hypothetical protein
MKDAKFDVFTVVKIQVEVFCYVTPCSVVVRYQRFEGPCCLHLQGEAFMNLIATAINEGKDGQCESFFLDPQFNYM